MTNEDAEKVIAAEMEPLRRQAKDYADSLLRDGFSTDAAAERLRMNADNMPDWYERTAKQECARVALLDKAQELSPSDRWPGEPQCESDTWGSPSKCANPRELAEQLIKENSPGYRAKEFVKDAVNGVRERVEYWKEDRAFRRTDEGKAEAARLAAIRDARILRQQQRNGRGPDLER